MRPHLDGRSNQHHCCKGREAFQPQRPGSRQLRLQQDQQQHGAHNAAEQERHQGQHPLQRAWRLQGQVGYWLDSVQAQVEH